VTQNRNPIQPVELFYSYAHEDEELRDELEKHLSVLKRDSVITSWHDRKIELGADWARQIDEHINTAQIILLLVSADFLASDYCYGVEMKRALERHRAKEARVIPVILRPCDWARSELGALQALPSGARAVTKWPLKDDALHDVAKGLRQIVAELRGPGVFPPPPPPPQPPLDLPCPYRGLEPFYPEHKDFFFGREELTTRLLEKLRPAALSSTANRFLAVIGPSGSGKSSLALAGLVPALKSGRLSDGVPWDVVICRPGDQPLKSLAARLASLGNATHSVATVNELANDLEGNADSLDVFVRAAPAAESQTRRVVVMIDQFEEVFALCQDGGTRQAFINNLLRAATARGGQTVVVLTMRADFYGKCASHPVLAAALSDHQLLVGPMTQEELERAIERPALRAGCELEMGLTERLIQDVERQSGALPLLQFALRELWEKRQGQLLTNAAYDAIGGLDGALEKRADAVLEAFTPTQLELCRRIFLRLTQPGEGTDDTKRRARMQELASAGDGGAAVEEVVDRLVDARLITAAADGDTRAEGGAIEVAHEALIRSWRALRQWIDADRTGFLIHHRLAEAAREWEGSGRHPDDLYKGTPLAVCRDWAKSHPDELNPLESDFFAESVKAEQRRKDAEIEAANQREADARRIATETKKKLRASRVALVSVLIAVAFGSAALWMRQQDARSRQQVQIQRSRLRADARAALDIARSRAADARTRKDLLRWESAVQAGERAISLARSADDDRLLNQVEAGFEEIQRDRQTAQLEAETAKKDGQIRHRLEEARIQAVGSTAEDTSGTFDPKRVVSEYRRILQDYGIDVDSLPSADAVRTIQRSAICQTLTAALDDLADSTPDSSLVQRIRTLAHEADPDPLRRSLRDALAQRDQAALKRIAQTPDLSHFERVTLERVGQALQSSGEIEGAAAFLRRAQQLHPHDFWINVALAGALSKLKPPKHEEAIRHFMAALALRPESTGLYVKLAGSLARVGDYDGALASLDRAIVKDPHSAWAYIARGATWTQKKDYDKGIADYNEAIRLEPQYALAYALRGAAWADKKEYDKAIAGYNEAIRLDPDHAIFYDARGDAWADKKEYDKAIADYDKTIRLDPKRVEAYNSRGRFWARKKDYDKAIAEYNEAIRLDRKYEVGYRNRGLVWFDRKEYDKAIADYDMAIQLAPKYIAAYSDRGNAWRALKNYDKAIADYNEAIRLDPQSAYSYNGRGVAWALKKEYDKAVADYDEAIRLDPKYARAFDNRGEVRYYKRDYDKAIAEYDEAIRIDPTDAWARIDRGNAWRDKKEYEKAMADYDEAIKLSAEIGSAYSNRGLAWNTKKEYDKAIADYNEAIRLDPKDAWAHVCRGVAQFLARRREAVQGFRETIRVHGWKNEKAGYAVILGNLAARQFGYPAEAKSFLEDAVGKLEPARPYPVIRYLRGEIDEQAVLAMSGDDDDRTVAHCYLGVDLVLRGRTAKAAAHFRWVVDHGNPRFVEFAIATGELDRLPKPDAPKPAMPGQ
jgi:tetratricopeptide (TPR) repeat protein